MIDKKNVMCVKYLCVCVCVHVFRLVDCIVSGCRFNVRSNLVPDFVSSFAFPIYFRERRHDRPCDATHESRDHMIPTVI